MRRRWAWCSLGLALCGCTEATGGGASAGSEPPPEDGATAIAVDVPPSGRALVRLATAEVLASPDDNEPSSTAWDLALSGYDVHTNSGLSGPGDGGAFGPLEPSALLADEAPEVPFLAKDKAGGAFLGWYAYDGGAHALWTRYHLYGVRDAGRTWKVQILAYYGELEGAPVSALYRIRYAEMHAAGFSPTVDIPDIDGTAGGSNPPDGAPSACLDLGTGQTTPLTPAEARASSSWHLCFRRDAVSINGELGGPRGVRAADLDAARTASEKLEDVQAKTPESEAPRFDAAGPAELEDPSVVYRGDRVVSAFSDLWFEPGASPPAPASAAWLVQGADGASTFLVAFERFEGAGEATPGRVHMRVKQLR